ncbi:MAG: glycosyltransferase family 39 protein [Anaerolineae bacterium]|nr:glycosyltransferase family 39 protein [Anaerolineae bacterium]
MDAQSLWWDEGISLHLAQSSLREIVLDRARNIHPPLYFFLLKGWISLTGSSAFSARYLSALATCILPTIAYTFTKKRVNEKSARMNLLLLTVAPLFIVYGQETRAYAFLPLLYLCMIAQIWLPKRYKVGVINASLGRQGLLLGFTQLSLIGFHYTGLLAVALGDFVLLYRSIFLKSVKDRTRLLLSAAVVIVFFTPWVVVVIKYGLPYVVQQAGISNPTDTPIPMHYLWQMLVSFQLYGMPESVSLVQHQRLLMLTGLSLLSAFTLNFQKWTTNGGLLTIMWWLAPFMGVPFIWILSPQAHPRYLMPYFLGGWLFSAVCFASYESRFWRTIWLAPLLASTLTGLSTYFTDPIYAKSDIRAVAEYLADTAIHGDRVLVPHGDWSLAQYDTSPADVRMVPLPQNDSELPSLLADIGIENNIYLLDYPRDVLDPRGYVRTILARQGYLIQRLPFHKTYLEQYRIQQPYSEVSCQYTRPTCVENEEICLTGYTLPEFAVSGAVLPFTLCWQTGSGEERYVLAFRLFTDEGILVSGGDDLLLDPKLLPSDQWVIAQSFVTYHRIPLPLGLLPEPFDLDVRIYPQSDPTRQVSLIDQTGRREASIVIGQTRPYTAIWVEQSPDTKRLVMNEVAVQMTSEITLRGTRVDPHQVTPGEKVYVNLIWETSDNPVSHVKPQLFLLQNERVLDQTDLWNLFNTVPAHRPLLDYAFLSIPSDAETGSAAIFVRMNPELQMVKLGDVKVVADQHYYVIPDVQYPIEASLPGTASLLGFNLPADLPLSVDKPFTITLFWQAGHDANQQNLKVFVQLLDGENTIVAQDDSEPVNWSRPTLGWVPGEILEDQHEVKWILRGPGSGRIIVGLYNGATGERVLWENGEDALELSLNVNYE